MNNNKKIVLYFAIAIGAIAALLADVYVPVQQNAANRQHALQQTLSKRQQRATAFIRASNLDSIVNIPVQRQDELNSLQADDTDILLYRGDSLAFWTRPPKINLEPVQRISTSGKFQRSADKLYEVFRHDISPGIHGVAVISALPSDIKVLSVSHDSTDISQIKLTTQDKTSEVFVQITNRNTDQLHQYLRLFLFLISFASLLVVVRHISASLMRHFPEWAASAFLLLSVFGLRMLYTVADVSKYFDGLKIFSKTLDSPYLGSSVGDFLLNSVLFLWLVIYWFNRFKAVSYDHLNNKVRLSLSVTIYFAIVLGIIMITGIIKSTILDSEIYFDFENIFNLSTESLVLILGLMIVFIALFLYSQRLMFTINLLRLTSTQRIVCILASLMLLFIFLKFVPIIAINLKFFLFILMYLLLLDFYSDSSTTDFTWLMIWLISFSSFSAALLYTYNQDKEEKQLKNYSALLANPRDKYLEESFREFSTRTASKGISNNQSSIVNQVYVSKFYNAIDSLNELAVSLWYPTGIEGLKWGLRHENGNTIYEYFPEKATNRILLETKDYMDFSLYSGISGTEDISYKGLKNLDKYGYALFYREYLVSQNSAYRNNAANQSNTSYKNLINQPFQVIGTRSIDPTGRETEINKTGGGFIKLLSLFSYLFVLMAATFLTLIALNTFFRFLPGSYAFERQSEISLRNRIQVAIISMIVVSFFAIGIITVVYFNYSNKKSLSDKIVRKVSELATRLTQSNMQMEAEALKTFSDELESELMLYDSAGRISISFPPKIQTILPELAYLPLHPAVINHSSNKGKGTFIQKYGKLYLVHAVASKDMKNAGYIVLPYTSSGITTNTQIADFIGALINTYVFLLLIASALALAIGRSITKPLMVLGDKLNRLKLGKQNEAISWAKNDEIGFLVKEYNQMIVKLEHSAGLLAKSEREEAWREMARQVAHEIKNPLTPMKLNVQYLLHSYHSDPESREKRIKNICDTLVQQIENLSAIAGTFGEFAQEPKINSEDLHLNVIVNGIYELFEKTGNEKLRFSKNLTCEDIIVHADKSHLIRIINNLIKNAIQAIPNDRIGKIEVSTVRQNNKVFIEVKDNGHGIEDSRKDKIFMPNFTTKSSGSGLGLAICKKLIESMDGEIYFTTVPDKGTSFIVRLPVKE